MLAHINFTPGSTGSNLASLSPSLPPSTSRSRPTTPTPTSYPYNTHIPILSVSLLDDMSCLLCSNLSPSTPSSPSWLPVTAFLLFFMRECQGQMPYLSNQSVLS